MKIIFYTLWQARFASAARLISICLLLIGVNSQAANPEAPDVLIKRIVNSVVPEVQSGRIKKGDIKAISNLVDEKIMPHVDFAKMTQLTIGKFWRDATPEQREKLMNEFKMLLVYTYSGAVNQVKELKIRYRASRYIEGDKESEVRSSITMQGAEPIEVSYRLELQDGLWKIYDLNVGGLWLVQNYKTSFEKEINKSGIDGLIKSLSDKNKELQSRQTK